MIVLREGRGLFMLGRRWATSLACLLVYGLCLFSRQSILAEGLPENAGVNAKSMESEFDASVLIGCWQDMPNSADALTFCHNFYEDGSYRQIFPEMGLFDRRLYIDGTWEIADGEIVISL